MNARLMSLRIRQEHDVVASRQRARQIAASIGFDSIEQTRIATAMSELARNVFMYAGGGTVEFEIEGDALPQLLVITVTDTGPGIANLQDVLEGRYRSPTGMGIGISGTRRPLEVPQVVQCLTPRVVRIERENAALSSGGLAQKGAQDRLAHIAASQDGERLSH